MSNLPPKPDFDPRDDNDRRSPPRHSDNDRRASSSRGLPPLADSYVAPTGDTYVPRHDERSRRPSPPPRSWRELSRRTPPPRRDEWRQRDELIDRRRDHPPRSRDYPRGGPRDRDWRRDRDYDDRDRHYLRRSPSPRRRWTSRESPSPPRRSTHDYKRRSPPYYSRRSASPPRYRRPSPGRKEDGRFSPRHQPPRDYDREGRSTYRRSHSRSRTRSRTPRPPAPPVETATTEPPPKAPLLAPAERIDVPQNILLPPERETSEGHIPESLAENAPVSAVGTDVAMAGIQPPTQLKAFPVNISGPPKSSNWPPPTGPRLASTTPAQLHQPPTPGIPPDPVPVQDSGSTAADTTNEEDRGIKMPEIPKFELPNPSTSTSSKDKNPFTTLDHTIKKLLHSSYVMRGEYGDTLKASRKAIHEQEMAEIELTAAKLRREVADSQLEKARFGLLGVDYDGISGLATNE